MVIIALLRVGFGLLLASALSAYGWFMWSLWTERVDGALGIMPRLLITAAVSGGVMIVSAAVSTVFEER